jgi:hypothetical protein
MNRRILLAFLTLPTVVSATLASVTLASTSFWMVVEPVHAESTPTSVTGPDATEAQNCKAPQDMPQAAPQSKPQNALQAQTIGSGTLLLDPLAEFKFTDAESDAAVARFGCDCPRHIRAIQAMALPSPCAPAATPAT